MRKAVGQGELLQVGGSLSTTSGLNTLLSNILLARIVLAEFKKGVNAEEPPPNTEGKPGKSDGSGKQARGKAKAKAKAKAKRKSPEPNEEPDPNAVNKRVRRKSAPKTGKK